MGLLFIKDKVRKSGGCHRPLCSTWCRPLYGAQSPHYPDTRGTDHCIKGGSGFRLELCNSYHCTQPVSGNIALFAKKSDSSASCVHSPTHKRTLPGISQHTYSVTHHLWGVSTATCFGKEVPYSGGGVNKQRYISQHASLDCIRH